MRTLPSVIERILETVYPPVCEGCGEAYFTGELSALCDRCREELLCPAEGNACPVCGQLFPGETSATFRCGNCAGRELNFDFATSPYRATGEMLDWIHRFKYGGEIHLARLFGQLLADVWKDERLRRVPRWTVVPVPLHPKRFRERGFNQALEIARVWRRHAPDGIDLPLAPILRRVRHTTRQATLDREERLDNLHGAFRLGRFARTRGLEGADFLLVDDVLTTGATASECAAVLREAFSARRIAVISVIRG